MRIEPIAYRVLDWEIRPNICTEVGDKIVYHQHDFPHLTLCWRGRWKYTVTHADGSVSAGELASVSLGAGVLDSRLAINANEMHEFEVIELEGGVATLECLWPDGVK